MPPLAWTLHWLTLVPEQKEIIKWTAAYFMEKVTATGTTNLVSSCAGTTYLILYVTFV